MDDPLCFWETAYLFMHKTGRGLKVPYSFAPAYMNRQRAAVVAHLIRYYKAGKYERAAEHRPDYLRMSQAERERAEREKKAKVIIREMTMEDAAAVAEMEHQIFSDAWSESSILETLHNPQTICLAAEKSGKVIGNLLAYTAADEAEIARISVLKEERKQGTGRLLLDMLKQISKERQIGKSAFG